MARLKQTIIGNAGYGEKTKDAEGMVDLSQAQVGQNGFSTDISGFVSNAMYVRRNLIAVLVEAPRGFQDLPNPEKWVATLKNLVELMPNSIEGLQSTLTVDYAEEAVGGAGEMQETESNVTRARSVPSFTWTEKYGKVINTFLTAWITNLIMDPITKVPNIMTRTTKRPTDILPDYNCMTVLFIEPDPTHTRVIHSWLSTNMKPKTGGEVTGRRDLTAGGEATQYSVEFTALTQEGLGVNTLAQKYLHEMNMVGVNPNLKQPFVTEIEQDVVAAETGYSERMATDSANAMATPTNNY